MPWQADEKGKIGARGRKSASLLATLDTRSRIAGEMQMAPGKDGGLIKLWKVGRASRPLRGTLSLVVAVVWRSKKQA